MHKHFIRYIKDPLLRDNLLTHKINIRGVLRKFQKITTGSIYHLQIYSNT